MAFQLVHGFDDQVVTFQLVEKPLLGPKRAIAVVDWLLSAPAEVAPALSYLLGLAEDEGNGIKVESTGVSVPKAMIAALTLASAARLGLPKVVPFILDLQHAGLITEPTFQFRVQWRDMNQRPIMGARRTGALITVGQQTYRIPEPQFTIIDSAEEFNTAPPDNRDARLAFWARMRPLLPEETQSSVQVNGYLRQTRIAHASSFSLVLKKSSDGFNFDPILFGEGTSASDTEHVHEIQSILPPAQQTTFAERRFPAHIDARSRYALDGGWYVTLSEDVRAALSVVRKAQQADQQTRWAFARNPRAFIRQALGDELQDDELSRLFIETFEYSQRVQGEGLWEHVVLPWVKKPTEVWLPPEEFGLQIGDKTVRITPDELPKLIERVEKAKQRGEATVQLNGMAIPATQTTLGALAALTGMARPEATRQVERSNTNKSETDPSIVLVISTNNETVEFLRAIVPRLTQLSDGTVARIKTSLKQHQVTGLAWLQKAWRSGMPGVVLADDMGLGKTLQALAFLAWRRDDIDRSVHRPMLVVAPTALLKNWEQEAKKHLDQPQLGALLKAYGPDLKRLRQSIGDELQVGRSLLDVQRIQAADWVLTTYETMRDYQHSFASVRFDTIVLDEIQRVKTPGTLMTHAAKALNGDFVVGLSGTPVENRLADLWCVVDSTYPGYLGGLAMFSSTYETELDPGKLRTLKASLTEPQGAVPQVMLRRMKVDHLPGLPQKREHVMSEVMPPAQARAYADAIDRARASSGKQAILQTLHSIRSISLHPLHPDLAMDTSYAQQSARFKAAISVLDQISDKGEKALIFLDSREMQRYLAGFLQRRYSLAHLPLQINGTVSGPERQSRVDKFQSRSHGFDVMILSPRAGGVGLTLTAANHVIHLSRWWNPAVEDQCSDRVYRIGQSKEVNIYYPQAVHPDFRDRSFDLTLHALLDRKRRLSTDLLMPPGGTDDDMDELFRKTVTGLGVDRPVTSDTSFPDIDSMEPTEFENWTLDHLRLAGYAVHKTPWSRDYGADGIGKKVGYRDVVVQCKHSQLRTTITAAAVKDLLRAKEAYGGNAPILVALTNSDSFSSDAVDMAMRNDVALITRSGLPKWPHNVV
jgi:hypothetical protein